MQISKQQKNRVSNSAVSQSKMHLIVQKKNANSILYYCKIVKQTESSSVRANMRYASMNGEANLVNGQQQRFWKNETSDQFFLKKSSRF